MSRSKKRISIFTDSHAKTNKWFKRLANKKVRKSEIIADGKQYRKVYNSYNICDWKFFQEKGSEWYNRGLRK